MQTTNTVFNPLSVMETIVLVQGLFLVCVAAFVACYFAGMTWGLYHCLRYFPEGNAKTRWILLIVFVPVAGPLAYCFAGRATCHRKFV